MDGYQSKLVKIVSGVPEGSVFLPIIVPPADLGAVFHAGE